MNWCVFWIETDSFSGKVSQHWIDTDTRAQANLVRDQKEQEGYDAHVALIADLTWHPSVKGL